MKIISYMLCRIVILLVLIYRYIVSPLLPQACRFQVTCSEYAISALKEYGFVVGMWKIIKRLCNCHPFSRMCHETEEYNNSLEREE